MWTVVDWKGRVWTVPAERMKAGREHRVPLSDAAVKLLEGLPRVSATWIFPTCRADRPMSENALLYALQSMFPDISVHGFRSTFSTWANDGRIAAEDIVEAALAHVIPGVRGIYDKGERFDARRVLMQAWAAAISVDVD